MAAMRTFLPFGVQRFYSTNSISTSVTISLWLNIWSLTKVTIHVRFEVRLGPGILAPKVSN
jgi:hypothetical protein